MHSNNLVGTIPASFANFGSATRVYVLINHLLIIFLIFLIFWVFSKVAQNNLTGTVPWQTNPGYDVFDARYNSFSCPLPEWCSSAGNGECEPCV